ncbi:acyl-CoA dehydrogenase [Enemella sp. A6]|uniref:acyl-CoA dehydrogenase n=1 Tax=Enemella sp. A6 TaxID=3440152 RepID=UPI003EBF7821
MTIGLTDEQVELHQLVQSFVSKQITEDVLRTAIDAESETLPEHWSNLAEMGLLAVHLDEEADGSGLGIAELAVVTEALGYGLVPGPFVPTVQASAILARAGHREHLRGLGDGSLIGAVAITPVKATPTGDGGYQLSGENLVVMSGHLADVLVLPVMHDGGINWVVLTGDQFTATQVNSHDLTRRTATVEVNTTVAAAAVLDIDFMLPWDVVSALYAAEASGIADWATRTATEYAKVREQFGRPIGQFQGVKHRVAWMLAHGEAARACAWDAANAIDDAPDEIGLAVSVAAATSVQAGFTNSKDLIQTLGGIGFTWEHLAGFYLRRAHTLRLTLGSEAHYQQRVARLVLSGVRRTLGVELPEEAEQIRAEIRAELEPAKAMDAGEQRRYLAEKGYTLPHLPQPWGKGASGLTQLVISEEIANAGVTPVDMVIGTWVVPSLIHWGTDAHREKFVPISLNGEISWCQLFSEPGAGSDLASIRTRAEKVEGGWKVNGQKVWTSMHIPPDYGILLARTDPDVPKHKGLSYFIVDMKSPGITIRPLRELTGEAMFNEVFLDDLFIPDDMIVGGPGDGWKVAITTLANERVGMSQLSSMGDGLEMLADLAQGKDDLETLTKIGSLVCESQSGRLLSLRETIRSISGAQPGPGSSVAKLFSGGHAQRVWETVVEMQGQRALIRPDEDDKERDPMWYFLNTRCLTIAGGTTDVQLNIIGERILGLPRDPEPTKK